MGIFIATEVLNDRGIKGEKLVWDSVKSAFETSSCLAYWRYPIFAQDSDFRKEPDILIADRLLGLIIIEVKAIKLEQLVNIRGHRWQYTNFYTNSGNPYQQAENQLFALLRYCDREPLLKGKITARAMVALPYITHAQWQSRGYERLPHSPPILFADSLLLSKNIIDTITNAHCAVAGTKITTTQWELLLAVLGGTALHTPDCESLHCATGSHRQILQQVRSRTNQLDLAQEKIARQIPPGMQRIRGIAGSGKTVLLCQKAVLMSIKYPQWQIALVFFSRSLYDVITRQVDKWMRHFSQDNYSYDAKSSNLKILHAWGSKQQPGFYSTVCKASGSKPLAVPFTSSKKPQEALAEACVELLENKAIKSLFDAVLIDEGQDLISSDWRYQNKQPFYWLAYQSLRPVNHVYPEQRRLIWAYDEMQSLDTLTVPDPVELFGEELGHLVTGKHYGINKTEVLANCYRTPQSIITIAHAIAMGLLRTRGILLSANYIEEWQALGYKVKGAWQQGNEVTITRSHANSPNLMSQLWSEDLISFNSYTSRQQELSQLAHNIKRNCDRGYLQPQEILVIVLGQTYDTSLLKQTAIFLINQGINIYLPSQSAINCLDTPPEQRNHNQFWHHNAVTLSTIHRAKGQEADFVYLIGLDRIAQAESNLYLRNQLFTALTRTRAWVNVSGIEDYSLYRELRELINSQNHNQISFTVSTPQRELQIGDRANLIRGYALGRINFRSANLAYADLSNLNLTNINLIEADLSYANLSGTNLSNAKLIAANLSHANLSHANLKKAKLISANLSHANLHEANLAYAQVSNTILDIDN